MKKTVKILALLTALTMSLTFFAGCGKDEKAAKEDDEKVEEKVGVKEEKPEEIAEENPEEEAGKVVQSYLDGYVKEITCAEDIEKNVGEFIAKDSDAYELMKSGMDEINSSANEGTALGVSEEYAKELVILVYNASNKNSAYSIKDSEADGEKVTVKVNAETPDVENFMESDEFGNEILTLLMDYLEENNMGLEVLMTNDKDAVNEIIAEFVNAKYDAIADYVEEMAKNAPKKTSEITFTVEKTDDKWLITKIDNPEDNE